MVEVVIANGCNGRETEKERQTLERGERWERIDMYLGYISLLCRYIILMCCMIKLNLRC